MSLSLLNNKNVGILLAAVSGIVIAACYVISSSSKSEKVHCVLKCKCGQVSAEITAPQSTPSASCHCHDCVNFVNWVQRSSQQVLYAK